MCVINVSNKRKTGKWRKICLFPAGFEPATLCVWGTRDNRYTMETCYGCRLLFGFHITGWLPKKWKKLSSHLGVEPRTFGLEVQRAIHCANGTPDTYWLYKIVLWLGCGRHCAIVVKKCSPFELVILIPRNVHEEGPKKTKILIARAGARTLDR